MIDNEHINYEKNIPKKRGRKPKNKFIYNNIDKESNTFTYDNIIVNLPIQLSEISSNEENKKINTLVENNKCNDTTKLFTFDISSEESESENINELKKKCIEYKNEIDKLNKKLKKKIKDKEIEEKIGIYKMNVNFIQLENNEQKYSSKTDIYCWWCCHPFNTSPCQLPDKYFDDKFYVYGCFCSYNCALSYNLDLDDYKTTERITLLHFLYKKVYNIDTIIKKALPRQTLKIFGGILTIEQFRKNFLNNDIKYNFIMPPLYSIIPLIDVDNKKKYNISIENKKKDKINTIDNFLGFKNKK